MACDPLTFPEPEPFTDTVPAGTYPLREAAFIPADRPEAPVPGGVQSAVTDERTGANRRRFHGGGR